MLHAAVRFSTASLRAGNIQGVRAAGTSARDIIGRFSKHPEHEDGEAPRGVTRHWTGAGDDLDLSVALVLPWHRDAECARPRYAGVDFFRDHARAREACAVCPVRLDCLEDALAHECEVRLCFGVRGGMLPKERLALIRQGETRGLVYFGWGNGLVKIGTTRGTIAERARTYGITMLATERGSYTRERELHKQFATDREHGEWFRPSDALLSYIAALPDQIDTQAPILLKEAA